MDYVWHIVTMMSLYVGLAVTLDVLVGRCGMISLAHVAFFGVGAYVAAICAKSLGASLAMCICIAAISGVCCSPVVALPAMRVRGDVYMLITLGIHTIFVDVCTNWTTVTGGSSGLFDIPPSQVWGMPLDTTSSWAAVSVLLAAVVYLVCALISRSPLMRSWAAIREDEIILAACGKSAWHGKLIAAAIACGGACALGAVYARYYGYIDPNAFNTTQSILVLSMVIVGGAGSATGPALGAAGLALLPEALRMAGVPGPLSSNLQQIAFGLLMTALMIVRPSGICGKYDFK